MQLYKLNISYYLVISFKYFSNSRIHPELCFFINSLQIIAKSELLQTISTSFLAFTQNQTQTAQEKIFFKLLIYFPKLSQNLDLEPVVIFCEIA